MAKELTAETQLALIRKDIGQIQADIHAIRDEVKSGFVPLAQFQLLEQDVKNIRIIVFGFVGIILLAVGGALVSSVVR